MGSIGNARIGIRGYTGITGIGMGYRWRERDMEGKEIGTWGRDTKFAKRSRCFRNILSRFVCSAACLKTQL